MIRRTGCRLGRAIFRPFLARVRAADSSLNSGEAPGDGEVRLAVRGREQGNVQLAALGHD